MFNLKSLKSLAEAKIEMFKKEYEIQADTVYHQVVFVKETAQQEKDGWMDVQLATSYGNYKGIQCISNDAVCLKLLQFPSTLPAVALHNNGSGVYSIIHNKHFESLPVKVKEAFMLHEYGHFIHKHLEADNAKKLNGQDYMKQRAEGNADILQQEYEADAYSQENGGEMLKALQYIKDTYPCKRGDKELIKRIEKLS